MDKLFTSYRRSMLPSGTRQTVHGMRQTVGDRSRKPLALLTAGCLALSAFLPSLGTLEAFAAPKSDDTITLRVCNWE